MTVSQEDVKRPGLRPDEAPAGHRQPERTDQRDPYALGPWTTQADERPLRAPRGGVGFEMPVDVTQNSSAYIISAELPGLQAKDIEVVIANQILTIRGEKQTKTELSRDSVFVRERRYGRFERSFSIPGEVDTARIDADFSDGVLTLTLSKG